MAMSVPARVDGFTVSLQAGWTLTSEKGGQEMDSKPALEEWLDEYKASTRRQYKFRWNYWCEWLRKRYAKDFGKLSDEEIANELRRLWKETEDRDGFLKSWGSMIIRYYQDVLEESGNVNTARGKVIAPRAFFNSQCGAVKIKRGTIAKPAEAVGEHAFSQTDLQKMYAVANARGRAILTAGVSLGWGVSDVLKLERAFVSKLVARAESEELEFIRFYVYRGKTKVKTMGVLTPEAIDSLAVWIKMLPEECKWLFPSNYGPRRMTDKALNDALKKMVDDAKIVTTGKIRFHLLRKFLMGALSHAGLNEWEVKTIVGKLIPVTDATYLQKIRDDAFEKYREKVYDLIRISKMLSRNHERLVGMSEQMEKFGRFIDLMTYLIEEKLREKGLLTEELKSLRSTDFEGWMAEVERLLHN